jgi:galactose mutarotase-like enzyme
MRIDTVTDAGLETWVAHDELSRLELVPARGGLITRWVADGDELLFLDRSTLVDLSKNVRGGIPLLFPFPGRPPSSSTLPQHGFARRLPWVMVGSTASEGHARLECELQSSAETRATFPFDFALRFAASVSRRRLSLEWAITNTGTQALPLHFGLHPYFRVPLATKALARLPHHASRAYDNVTKREVPAPQLDFSGPEVDLHLLDHAPPAVQLERGDSHQLKLSWSKQFTTLVVWTLPDRDFICVEPWTAPAGALETGAGLVQVAPATTERLTVEVEVRPPGP